MHRGCRFLAAARFQRRHGMTVLGRRPLDGGMKGLLATPRHDERAEADTRRDDARASPMNAEKAHGCSPVRQRAI
jgi:hypothetical protein